MAQILNFKLFKILKVSIPFFVCSIFSLIVMGNDNDKKFAGSYEVPTANSSLSGVAAFKLPVKQRSLADGRIKLSYDLPAALTGLEQDIEVINSLESPSVYKGVNADCECLQVDNEIACVLKYKDLQGSQLAAENFLNSLSLPQGELEKRLSIAKLFACDPVGVLQFNLNQSPLNPQSEIMKTLRDRVLASSTCVGI